MTRINDLNAITRLDLIEEARWQNGNEYVNECINDNAYIGELCDWAKTRQGHEYWNWIDNGYVDPIFN